MVNRITCSSILRAEVNKNPDLKALSKKPMGQLTDDELYATYAPQFRYLSDASEPDPNFVCQCTLCLIRRGQMTEEQVREMVWGKQSEKK